jgi:HD-like signal output (HDOD) protein
MTLKQLTERMPSLGSYAGVMAELEHLLEDPNSTLANFGECIEKDPDLASRLLKLANSAFYGFSRRLHTVAEAVSLLGIQQLQTLIRASSVIEVFDGIAPAEVDMESFWKHSLACGIAARALGVARQFPTADKLFVAGLLHDLGRLVLLGRMPGKAAEIFKLYQSRKMLLRDAERAVLGFDHSQIGEELARGWQFPSNLVGAIGDHHHPMLAGFFQLESSVVHLADYLVHVMQVGNSGEKYVPPLDERAWERVGLSVHVVETVMRVVDEQVDDLQRSFLCTWRSRQRTRE